MDDVEEHVRGIGRMARESGLTVSALRFYDGAGVLVPAAVDPRNGYRSYGADQVRAARLVATLRRVGMPLADVRRVLEHRRDPAVVDAVLGAHLARLEQGLVDARRELSAARSHRWSAGSPWTRPRCAPRSPPRRCTRGAASRTASSSRSACWGRDPRRAEEVSMLMPVRLG